MKFKLDENLPDSAAGPLSEAGHDAATIVQQGMSGNPDPQVADVCRREERVLVTLDVGFADIRMYPPGSHAGIIVLRLRYQDARSVVEIMERLVGTLEVEAIAGKLWIVDEERVRIRD